MWNPIGFPRIHPDEGAYIGRSIHVSDGLGPKEDAARYDHPYFGWLFLGSIFNLIGYPGSANPTPGDANSVEMIWLFPRATMGILSVIDTFLIYKIAERRYNGNVAFIAAILFAVMPYTWLIRRVLLEPIQLPFLLASILFALYSGTKEKTNTKTKTKSKSEEMVQAKSTTEENKQASEETMQRGKQRKEDSYDRYYKNYNYKRSIMLLFSSGIFLGLTIFTKIPAIALIPVVGFIVFTNNRKSFKALGIWIIPVILIPSIWPIQALTGGDFDQWQDGITRHITRADRPLLGAIEYFYNEDRVLLILGLASFVFAAVTRKDFIFLIWVIPFLALLYIVNYASTFHLIPLIPVFCIGAAVMIADLSYKIAKNKKSIRKISPLVIVSAIAIFGLTTTTSLIGRDMNSHDFDVIALVTQYLPAADANRLEVKSDESEGSKNDPVTIVARDHYKFWMFQYVFDELEYDYKTPVNMVSKMTLENAKDGSEKVLIMADEDLRKIVSGEELPRTREAELKAERISDLYNNTKTVAKTHNVEIRTNY